MPLGPDAGSPRGSFLSRHFGSKAARFKGAVSVGFIIAAVGFVALGPGGRSLMADESLFGSLSRLFGQTSQPVQRAVQYDYGDQQRNHDGQQSTLGRRHAHRRVAVLHYASARAPAPSIHQMSLCVRLCDGFAFPVGTYRGEDDQAAHQAICQSTCPDAATALFVLPAGSERINDAMQVNSGRTYSQLPDAFHYTTVLDDACTCHKAGSGAKSRMSFLRDFTLRRGDAVMTAAGVKVFHGKGQFPYRRTDFVALARSHDIGKTDRAAIGAMERASLKPPADAQASPMFSERAPTAPLSRPRLEHQARMD